MVRCGGRLAVRRIIGYLGFSVVGVVAGEVRVEDEWMLAFLCYMIK